MVQVRTASPQPFTHVAGAAGAARAENLFLIFQRRFAVVKVGRDVSIRYFEKLPVATPSSVQVENTHFAVMIKVLMDNAVLMVGTESRTQMLLKYRFALHLLTFVNEDSRLLLLKLANIVAGLK
jgi:hypothetical protein